MNTAHRTNGEGLHWPPEGVTRVPYQVFVDPAIYAREQEKIFRGPAWNYVGLEAELPTPGDYKATFVDDRRVADKGGLIIPGVGQFGFQADIVPRRAAKNLFLFACINGRIDEHLIGDTGDAFWRPVESCLGCNTCAVHNILSLSLVRQLLVPVVTFSPERIRTFGI